MIKISKKYPYPPQLEVYSKIRIDQELTVPKHREKDMLESYGFIHSIPTLNLIWILSIILLIITVELNIFINVNGNKIFGGIRPFVGITILGVLLGILFSYIQYEYRNFKIQEHESSEKPYKNIIKIVAFALIGIFITIEIVIQLFNFRGIVAIVDSLGIMAVACGTYGILAKNRAMIFPTIFILFIIGGLKINFSQDILFLLILSGLFLFYVLISDTTIQYFQLIDRIRTSYESTNIKRFDLHYDKILSNYLKYLTIFIIISTLTVGFLYLLNRVQVLFFPIFISENLELQTVYGLLPPALLLFIILFIIWGIRRFDIIAAVRKFLEKYRSGF